MYIDLLPSQTCHSKDSGSDTFRWQLWEEIALAGSADKIGQGKIPWYSHRLMHRKRTTCELHGSYFRLMMIKRAVPKIEWAIELLYNSLKTGSQFSIETSLETSEFWRPDPLVTRCGRESPHPAEWAPSSPVEQLRRAGKRR